MLRNDSNQHELLLGYKNYGLGVNISSMYSTDIRQELFTLSTEMKFDEILNQLSNEDITFVEELLMTVSIFLLFIIYLVFR